MSATVFVLGSFVADCAFRAARLPVLGETLLGSNFVLGPGGKGSNQAVAAARAGAQVTFLTSVGQDAFGEIGRSLWAKEGIDSSFVRTAEAPTGSAAILIDQDSGANAIIVVPGACADIIPEDVDRAAAEIRRSVVFVAQLEISLEAVRRGLEIAHTAGVTTILNPAPAPLEPLPSDVLRLVDYLIPNETEIAGLTGLPVDTLEEVRAAAERLLADGPANVLVTLGERGSFLLESGREGCYVRAFAAGKVIDSSGAGDAFCGAFATALAGGADSAQAAEFASVAAGIAVCRPGTASSMPHGSEIEAQLRLIEAQDSRE